MADNVVSLEGLHKLHQAEVWLRAMELRGRTAANLLHELGNALVDQTQERIRVERAAPDGTAWAGWSESYTAWRDRIGHNPGEGIGIGVDKAGSYVASGKMLQGISYNLINQYALEWGSSAEYAGYFNGNDDYPRKRDYPLRPFIGINEANEKALEDEAEEYLERLGRRAEP